MVYQISSKVENGYCPYYSFEVFRHDYKANTMCAILNHIVEEYDLEVKEQQDEDIEEPRYVSMDDIGNLLDCYFSMHETDAICDMIAERVNTDDIMSYIKWCDERYQNDLDTEFEHYKKENLEM